ncbi:myotrophin homolog isoform X2 [Tachypleus tridentatus]|uniref:myotrophin homolog isoform X2 n=1 Tax=Tachypleus tridentatus TaxID=6853 RepID=UPI003FD303C3
MSDFIWSLKNGDIEQVKDHVENKRVDINQVIDGRPPIHYAADYGQTEVATDKHGISALLAAIWEGHTSCVKLMLEKGANKCGTTPDGTSYLDAAEKQEIKDLLK